jgi:hypothetical protein
MRRPLVPNINISATAKNDRAKHGPSCSPLNYNAQLENIAQQVALSTPDDCLTKVTCTRYYPNSLGAADIWGPVPDI